MRRLKQSGFFGGGGTSSAAGATSKKESNSFSSLLVVIVLLLTLLFVKMVYDEEDIGVGSSPASASASSGGARLASLSAAAVAPKATSRNIPDVYAMPWQYGLRATKSAGGGDDAELTAVTPQGSPQELAPEASFYQSGANGAPTDEERASIVEQIEQMTKRLYDSPDLLRAFQNVMQNQRNYASEHNNGQPGPIQVLRASEDEMPLRLNW